MKRIFILLPPWIAAFFTAAFLAVMPMVYYAHLSSCHHGHGCFSHAGCRRGECTGVFCHLDALSGESIDLTLPRNQDHSTHDSSTCPICQGMTKLHQMVHCRIAGIFMRLEVVAAPSPVITASPFLAFQVQTHPRAPPIC